MPKPTDTLGHEQNDSKYIESALIVNLFPKCLSSLLISHLILISTNLVCGYSCTMHLGADNLSVRFDSPIRWWSSWDPFKKCTSYIVDSNMCNASSTVAARASASDSAISTEEESFIIATLMNMLWGGCCVLTTNMPSPVSLGVETAWSA